ncbi:hypothetical protein SLV14_003237 [Streptomyces sp. Je 1-4]|uniref:hypothetical protein n=1 Tax=Streptomyces TaxID=1883 RepID=UPI0021D843BC|nr:MULTISPECIES: hypothetical protein [unclassified Streptomyces]UYB40591.1 hypothetical protein SLV14_003237 [Streptomyces sp. Je 1-4]UZQ36725.1 hypothetical protein SLV14N_003237 [Streptomyces sp. Je 1-4] [Streptomyces sp. Je 1-4 4N24]UZQ44142.1 hypothetical protein SLV14NA_003237 [Streptomyces sp. Je 1-4] [Streptomyces sp. Je 1-4 4N24_ara]
MFNRIRHTVSHTDGRCAPMSRPYRSPMPVGPASALRDPFAHDWFAAAEAL